MCQGCWEENESPQIDSEKVRKAAELIEEVYKTEITGGAGHVVFDDWNIEDSNVLWCLDDKNTGDYRTGDCGAALRHFLTLTVEERASALGLVDGFWSIENG